MRNYGYTPNPRILDMAWINLVEVSNRSKESCAFICNFTTAISAGKWDSFTEIFYDFLKV
jgi:hypothetical protein